MVGPKATFITVGHPVDPGERRRFLSGAPIDVAENVWIGAGATILPGVSIGREPGGRVQGHGAPTLVAPDRADTGSGGLGALSPGIRPARVVAVPQGPEAATALGVMKRGLTVVLSTRSERVGPPARR
ncbi:hypothetical protein [Nocardiopsis synnemataformans]|uniref:hypothetical protein n=1 Tax=Nocardiopsis synnemataformans TaxID=61305 RepID=UPI003EB9C706